MADFDETKWEVVKPSAPSAVGYDSSKWEPVKGADTTGGPTASFRKPIPLAVETGEEGIGVAGQVAGGLAGAAAGTAVEPGAGTYVGARAGEATGMTAADAINAEINQHLFGRQTNLGLKDLGLDWMENLSSSVAGHHLAKWLTPLIGQFGKKLLGINAAETSVRAASDVAAATREGVQAKGTAIGEKAMEDIAGAQTKAVKEAGPAARQEVLTTSTAKTPEQSIAAISAPAETPEAGVAIVPKELADRQVALRKTISDIRQRGQDYLGKQYDALLGKHREIQLETEPIGEEFEGQAKGEGQHELTPTFRAWLERKGKELNPPTGLDETTLRDGSPESMAKIQDILKKDGWKPAQFKEFTNKEQASAALRYLKEHPPEKKPFGFKDLRDLRTELRENVPSTPTNLDQRTANDLIKSLSQREQQTLEKAGATPQQIAGLRSLDERYRAQQSVFDRAFRRDVAGVAEPTDVAAKLFNDPSLAQVVTAGANDEEKGVIKDLYSDWANRQSEQGKNVLNPEHAEFLGRLYPGSPLANRQSIAFADSTLKNLEAAPNTNAMMQTALDQESSKILGQSADAFSKSALAEAQKLGPVGKQMMVAIMKGQTPQERASIALKEFTDLTPEEFVQRLGQSQPRFGQLVSKKIGKQESQGAQHWFQRQAERTGALPVFLTMAALSGSGYWKALAALGTGYAIRRTAQNAFIRGLADPAAAKAFVTGVGAATKGQFAPLAQAGLQAMIARGTADITKKITGDPLEEQLSPQDKAKLAPEFRHEEPKHNPHEEPASP